MILIQQIIPTVVVDFQVAYVDLVRVGVPLGDLIEDIRNGPGDDTAVGVTLSSTSDSVGLTRTSLAVCKYSAVVSVETTVYHVLGNRVEHCFLLREHVEHTVEYEVVYSIFNILVSCLLAISLNSELNFIALGIEC